MKKIIALFIVLAMAICPVTSFAFADVDLPETIIKDMINWDFDEKAGSLFEVVDSGDPDHGKVGLFFEYASSKSISSWSGATGNMIYEMDLAFLTDENGNNRNGSAINLFYTGNESTLTLAITAANKLTLLGSDTGVTIADDTWYKIRLVVERGTGKMTLYVDDMEEPVKVVATSKVKAPYRVYATGMKPAWFDNEVITAFVDNIRCYFTAKPYLTDLECYDRDGNVVTSDAVDYKAAKVDVLFSQVMDPETFSYNAAAEDGTPIVLPAIKITNEFGREIPYTGAINEDNNAYTLTFEEELRPKTTYTITGEYIKSVDGTATFVNGAESDVFTNQFTTGYGDFAVTAIEEGAVAGENITYNVSVQNLDSSEAATLVVAKYDGAQLTGVGTTPISGTDTYSVTVKNAGSEVEAFIMSADGTFKLLDKFSE